MADWHFTTLLLKRRPCQSTLLWSMQVRIDQDCDWTIDHDWCLSGQDAGAVDNKERSSEYYMEHGEEIKLPEVNIDNSHEVNIVVAIDFPLLSWYDHQYNNPMTQHNISVTRYSSLESYFSIELSRKWLWGDTKVHSQSEGFGNIRIKH